MRVIKENYLKLFSISILLIVLIVGISIFFNQSTKSDKPIILNLLTSVHPNLPWTFKPINSKSPI